VATVSASRGKKPAGAHEGHVVIAARLIR